MQTLVLHDFHAENGAHFCKVDEAEMVQDYGDVSAEYTALQTQAILADLSGRGRLCLTGADRARFLHGQVTNDIKRLKPGEGCYATIITAKGRMESDLNVYFLADELLLDFEPGLESKVSQRLDRYIIADDVQVIPIGEAYGVLTVQGQSSKDVFIKSNLSNQVPSKPFESIKIAPEIADDIYVVNHSRFGTDGYDIFVPAAALLEVATKLLGAVRAIGGRLGGWDAMEVARIEAGIPRFGADMDETTIPLEAGLEARAISFNKGCYIGQEVISRIKTYGQVTKRLRRLKLTPENTHVPQKRDKLFYNGKEVGYVTSAISSANYQGVPALGYVRKEVTDPAALLEVRGAWGSCLAGWEELK